MTEKSVQTLKHNLKKQLLNCKADLSMEDMVSRFLCTREAHPELKLVRHQQNWYSNNYLEPGYPCSSLITNALKEHIFKVRFVNLRWGKLYSPVRTEKSASNGK